MRQIILIFQSFLLVIIQAIRQEDIIVEALPNSGNIHPNRFSTYRHVLTITNKTQIRFGVQAGNDAHLLLSDKHANTIDINTDYNYIEVEFGGSGNTQSLIRVSTMLGQLGAANTPNILDSSTIKYFWVSWYGGVVKGGHGFDIDQNIIMESSYPANIDIKYLALWSGFGSSGTWHLYNGNSPLKY